MYRQFGVAPAKASEKRTVQNFRSEVLRELKKIKIAWPELNYTTAPGFLILLPSAPAIPPAGQLFAPGIAPQVTFPRARIALWRPRRGGLDLLRASPFPEVT